jgi:hypothetical protein
VLPLSFSHAAPVVCCRWQLHSGIESRFGRRVFARRAQCSASHRTHTHPGPTWKASIGARCTWDCRWRKWRLYLTTGPALVAATGPTAATGCSDSSARSKAAAGWAAWPLSPPLWVVAPLWLWLDRGPAPGAARVRVWGPALGTPAAPAPHRKQATSKPKANKE